MKSKNTNAIKKKSPSKIKYYPYYCDDCFEQFYLDKKRDASLLHCPICQNDVKAGIWKQSSEYKTLQMTIKQVKEAHLNPYQLALCFAFAQQHSLSLWSGYFVQQSYFLDHHYDRGEDSHGDGWGFFTRDNSFIQIAVDFGNGNVLPGCVDDNGKPLLDEMLNQMYSEAALWRQTRWYGLTGPTHVVINPLDYMMPAMKKITTPEDFVSFARQMGLENMDTRFGGAVKNAKI